MKISVHKYLLYSSVFAIFTESFFFNFIIDWKLLYLIIFINFFLLFKLKKITINTFFLFLLLFIFFHGLILDFFIRIPPNFMISQIIGILIISTYYYNFIPLYSKEQIIEVYLKLCVYVAILGFLLWLIPINKSDIRLHSIFKEPAHYSIVVLPACYYFLKKKNYFLFLIIFISLLLSQSSLGYMGCGLIFIIPYLDFKRIKYLLFLTPILGFIFYSVYLNNENVKTRVDDTYNSFTAIKTGKFKNETNVSSYALMSNLYVAKCNFLDHPFGSGIGSHLYMHKNTYSKTMRPPGYIKTLKLADINATDANSMALRIFSDFGVFGVLFLIYFLYISHSCYYSKNLIFAQGIYIYILLKLFRDGHYFAPEFYFFIWMFYFYLYDEKKTKLIV